MKRTTGKKIRRISLLIIAVSAISLCALRWETWFGQPEEEPYTPLPYPHRVMLTFGDNGELSRNVSWRCDTAVKEAYLALSEHAVDGMQPEKRIEAVGEVFRSRAGKGAYYVARLDSLKPDTEYSYRAVTGGKSSPAYRFRTHAPGERRMSFIYVGDVQDTIGGVANRYLREAFGRYPDAEMLVCGGDLVERPRDSDWEEAFRSVDSICTAMPMLVATGNHDYLKGLFYRLERRFTLVFSYFINSKVGNNHVYALRYGPAEFFLLDSTRGWAYLLTQRGWLKRALAASDARWKIVIVHHPLYSLRGHSNNLIERWIFADVIEDEPVDLVLQGHEHNYARRFTDGHTPLYITSHCSPKSYSHKSEDLFEKTAFDSRFYQYISISGDSLTFVARDVYDHALVDSVTIIK